MSLRPAPADGEQRARTSFMDTLTRCALPCGPSFFRKRMERALLDDIIASLPARGGRAEPVAAPPFEPADHDAHAPAEPPMRAASPSTDGDDGDDESDDGGGDSGDDERHQALGALAMRVLGKERAAHLVDALGAPQPDVLAADDLDAMSETYGLPSVPSAESPRPAGQQGVLVCTKRDVRRSDGSAIGTVQMRGGGERHVYAIRIDAPRGLVARMSTPVRLYLLQKPPSHASQGGVIGALTHGGAGELKPSRALAELRYSTGGAHAPHCAEVERAARMLLAVGR